VQRHTKVPNRTGLSGPPFTKNRFKRCVHLGTDRPERPPEPPLFKAVGLGFDDSFRPLEGAAPDARLLPNLAMQLIKKHNMEAIAAGDDRVEIARHPQIQDNKRADPGLQHGGQGGLA
jgi:hypothetical protein